MCKFASYRVDGNVIYDSDDGIFQSFGSPCWKGPNPGTVFTSLYSWSVLNVSGSHREDCDVETSVVLHS